MHAKKRKKLQERAKRKKQLADKKMQCLAQHFHSAMKVDAHGHVFAPGPGGVLVFAADGTHLGTFDTGQPTANCAWGDDGSVLYITANMYLGRVRLTTKGPGF